MKKVLICLFVLALLAGCGGGQTAKKDVFTSIKDAISKQIALRCEYTDENGNTSINYIKGNMIRVDGKVGEQASSALMRDDKIYVWTADSKEGFVMDMKGLQNSSDIKMGGEKIQTTEDIINKLEAEKTKCHAEAVPDSMFVVPSEINFSDWSKLMNSIGK
jgi:hypothetical protein